MFRHVDLCSGIGGFALGFEWAGLSQPVLFCDTERWCRDVLHKHWPDVPIEEDVKVLANDPERLVPDCDIITAGYPCQPFSLAGERRGQEDPRHIWPHIRKIVAFKRPSWVVFENVYGHISMGLDDVLADLESEGYAARAFVVPACGVGAPHRRDRVWIVGNATHDRRNRWATKAERAGQTHQSDEPRPDLRGQPSGPSKAVAYTDSQRGRRRDAKWQDAETIRQSPCNSWHNTEGMGIWDAEPDVGRVAHGISRRVDRLKGLGNAIVPQIAKQIGIAIGQCEAGASRQFKA